MAGWPHPGRRRSHFAKRPDPMPVLPADRPPFPCRTSAPAGRLPTRLAVMALALALGGCSLNLDMLSGSGGKTSGETAASPTLDKLSAAINANPHDPDAYYQRGLLYQAEGRHEHAIADFSSAIGLTARELGALAARGASYLATGKTYEAAADLDEAVRLDPDNATAWMLRGQAYEKLAATPEAATSYRRALALHPDDEEARAGVARVGGEADVSKDAL